MKHKEPVGLSARVNGELAKELKGQLDKAVGVAMAYGLPSLALLLESHSVPGPFAAAATATIKYAVDDIIKNNTEDAEIRALTLQSCVAHSHLHSKAYRTVTPEYLRSLFQRLTKKATELRQEDRIRAVVAATLGGSDADLATSEDLIAAEWIETADDSKLLYLSKLCPELFGGEPIQTITRTPAPWPNVKPLEPIYTPCVGGITEPVVATIQERTYWWPWQNLRQVLFEGMKNQYNQVGPHSCIVFQKGSGAIREWPSPLLQRIHNAFVRSKQMMAFDLKQAAEAAKASKA
jgi:hypothetical protein